MLRKCLFPVAGHGTRFMTWTKAMPKEMLPILGTPLLQYGVQEAYESGMRDMLFVTGKGKRAIEDHFDQSKEVTDLLLIRPDLHVIFEPLQKLMKECTFTYTRQGEARGLGHAVLSGQRMIGDEPFAVILADDLCISRDLTGRLLAQMTKVFLQEKCNVVAVMEVAAFERSKYGIVGYDLAIGQKEKIFEVKELREKPRDNEPPFNSLGQPSRYAIIGRYILNYQIFDYIKRTPPGKNDEIQLTQALALMLDDWKNNDGKDHDPRRIVAFRYSGDRFDCGDVEGFINANDWFLRRSREISPVL